jgi:hypothetical protein
MCNLIIFKNYFKDKLACLILLAPAKPDASFVFLLLQKSSSRPDKSFFIKHIF